MFQFLYSRVLSLVLIPNMFPLKVLGTQFYFALQYRQRAVQRETETGTSFVSFNEIVLLSVSVLEMSDICCDCFSVVVVVVVIITNLTNSWIYSPLYLHMLSAKKLLKKPKHFYTYYCRRGCYFYMPI